MCGGAHGGLRLRGQFGGHGVDQRRLDEGFVALHVHDDRVVRQREPGAGLGEAIAAARVVGAREQRVDAVRGAGIDDARMVCGDDDARGAGGLGALCHAHHHRHAADVGERLVGQARGGEARWNQDGEGHQRPSSSSDKVRASFSSSTGMPSRTG
jgi:hypothetical protein